MEIGYLMPPVATNLFVAAAVFKKTFGQVSRAVMPTLGITCAALLLFMYVPTCSKGLPNLTKGEAVWEPFPWDGKPAHERRAATDAEEIGDLSSGALDRAQHLDGGVDKALDQQDEDPYGLNTPDAGPAGDAGLGGSFLEEFGQ
jgi:hypothetical protein